MTNTFIAALDCLTERGYPNALELANEIELNWMDNKKNRKKPVDLDELKAIIFDVVKPYHQSYTVITGKDYSKSKQGVRLFKTMPMTLEAVESPSRKREITLVRFIMMNVILAIEKKVTFKEVGLRFGGRDHSTVIHAKLTLKDLLDVDKKLSAEYAEILDKVKSIVK